MGRRQTAERFGPLAHLGGDCRVKPEPMHITSRDNSLLRQVRAVRDGKIKELIFVEGLRLCEETQRSHLEIEAVIVSDELMRKDRAAGAIEELSRVSKRVGTVSEKLLASVSYTKTPQGIIVLAQRPEASEKRLAASLDANSLLVVLHQINNPVNVGAILRTAEAAGATGVIVTVCADVEATTSYTDIDWTGPIALILGPESTGLTAEELDSADQRVSIPMRGDAESLNVSVAAGILLFEASRQRV